MGSRGLLQGDSTSQPPNHLPPFQYFPVIFNVDPWAPLQGFWLGESSVKSQVICISDNFSGDTDVAGLGTTLWDPVLYISLYLGELCINGGQLCGEERDLTFTEYLWHLFCARYLGASLVAQVVKNLSAVQETWVQSLTGEDPLEEEMATHSSNLAWRIPWTEQPDGLWSMGSQRVRHDLVCLHAGTSAALCTYCPM